MGEFSSNLTNSPVGTLVDYFAETTIKCLLSYHPTTLLHYHPITLQHCHTATLQHHNPSKLLSTTLLYYHTTTIHDYHNTTTLLHHYTVTLVTWHVIWLKRGRLTTSSQHCSVRPSSTGIEQNSNIRTCIKYAPVTELQKSVILIFGWNKLYIYQSWCWQCFSTNRVVRK